MERRKDPALRGRGAQSDRVPDRFGLAKREADGDWRDWIEKLDGPPVKLRTTVTEEHPKTILTFNQSPDVGFDRSINAYRGCEHGCIYCFARPTHAFHDLSPGLDFETKLFAKPNAAALLRETLARPKYRPRQIAMGTNTDPYQPIEGRYRITRSLLEPRAPAPAKRLAALGSLVEAGVPAHCSIAPVIPAITDEFIEEILLRAGALGVRSAGWIPLRLPYEVAPLFREWLSVHFPERGDKVMGIVRAIRGGRDNDPGFFTRMKPIGVWADLLRARFRLARKRAGIDNPRFELDCSAFRRPSANGQLPLL